MGEGFQHVFQLLFTAVAYLCFAGQPDYRHTLKELIDFTEELVRNHVRESAWVVMAVSQRVNADANVKSCIA